MDITALPKNYFGAILADPPWAFTLWNGKDKRVASRGSVTPYDTMQIEDIAALPVASLAAKDSVLFLWCVWPSIREAFDIIEAWGFKYKTCGFCWVKADNTQPDFFNSELEADMRLGYWTRSNSEVCLLATRGKPKRLNADVRQGIIAPIRQHSRKPEGIHQRIERLIAGPYLELFARQERKDWTVWGNETDKFRQAAE